VLGIAGVSAEKTVIVSGHESTDHAGTRAPADTDAETSAECDEPPPDDEAAQTSADAVLQESLPPEPGDAH